MSSAAASGLFASDPVHRLRADVLVCGGGVAGCMAAVAAARAGAKVLLLERYGFLGGNATAGAVAQFNSWQTAAGRTVVAGQAQEVVDRLRQLGAAGPHEVFTMSTGHRMDRVAYSPEVLKLVLDQMLSEAGATPLFHASVAGVLKNGPRVAAVQALSRGGLVQVDANVLVDASGDMELLRLAGAQFLELEAGEALQPATQMFRFGPVDFERFDAIPQARRKTLADAGYARGHLPRAALHMAREPGSADAWFNISRLEVDATDPLALSRAETLGREQAWRSAAYLKAQVPGCDQGRLVAFGTQVGVRETRRVQGEHVLTAQELLAPQPFDDAIAAGAYPIDVHPAQGGGLHYQALGEEHAYQIPYRSLVPLGLANVLAAGRGLSATHEALAAVRVMPISMAVGQAAGSAASLLAQTPVGSTARARAGALDCTRLRQHLVGQGAILA